MQHTHRRTQILWAISALLLAWIVVMAIISGLNASCALHGERFSARAWACVPLGPPIILQRDLQRG